MNGLAKAWHYLAREPVAKRSWPLFMFRLAQILHERASGRLDGWFLRALSLLRPEAKLPRSRVLDESQLTSTVATLRDRGWDILPWRLPAGDLAAITAFAFATPAYADHPGERVRIDASHIPTDRGRYEWLMSDLIRLPAIQKLIADGALHRIAQDYIGCRPVLTSVTLWLDPVFGGHYDAHVYHYDNDGPAFLKFFIYINDVDADSGAHNYIQRSHRHTKPQRFRKSQRYDRGDLLGHYGSENELVFAAPAGTILAEDTAGFHRGMDLRKGYRLLLQLEHAALDIPHLEEFARGIDRVSAPNLDPAIRRIARKFFR